MRRSDDKGISFGLIATVFLLGAAMLAFPAISRPAEQEEALKISYEGQQLSVNAVDVEAVRILQQIADRAKFKLVTTGFPESFKVDVSFSDLPLDKGIDRVVKTLRSKASVSHVAVYKRKGEREVLYSLRVTYSGSARQRAAPVLPAPRARTIERPPLPSPAKREPAAKEAGKKEAEEQKKLLRQEIEQEFMERLRQEGWSEEEITEHLQILRRGRD